MKKIILLLMMVMLVSVFGGCSKEKVEEAKPVGAETEAEIKVESRLDKIKKSGKLVLATGNYRPFEYRDEKTNEMVGYDVDLARMFAEDLGVELVVNDMTFTSLIPTLQNGNADLIIAAMYIKPEREEVVDFANPYMDTGIVLVIKEGTQGIEVAEDLEDKVVGVKLGGSSEVAGQELLDKGMKFKMNTYKENTDMLLDLESGRIDVAFNDYLYQLEYNKTHPDMKIVGDVFNKAELGIAVKQGDQELLDFINEKLAEYEAAGKTEELFKKWISAE